MVEVISAINGSLVGYIPVGQSPIGIAIDTLKNLVFIADQGSNDLEAINMLSNTVVAKISLPASPYGVTVSPNGQSVYVSEPSTGTISVINVASNSIVGTISLGSSSQPQSIVVTPNGSTLYISSNGGGVYVVNAATNSLINTVPLNSSAVGIVVSPDGLWIYAASNNSFNENSSIKVISTATQTVVDSIGIGYNYGIIFLSISPNGLNLYASSNFALDLIHTVNGSVTVIANIENEFTGDISLSSDGSLIYLVNSSSYINSNFISVYNTSTNSVTQTIPLPNGPDMVGNFVTPVLPCNGSPISFTITVNPTPAIQVSTVSGQISSCTGTPAAYPAIEWAYISGNNLQGGIMLSAPSGFVVSLNSSGPFGVSLTIPEINGLVDSVPVYIASSSTALTGYQTAELSLSSPGAVVQPLSVSELVNGIPSTGPIPNQVVNSGEMTNPVNFSGKESFISWTNNMPSIGLAASGNGNIQAFQAINNGSSPVVATVTAIPIAGSIAYIPDESSDSVFVVDVSEDSVIGSIQVGNNPFAVIYSQDGTKAYVENLSSSFISVISTATNTVIATINTGLSGTGYSVGGNPGTGNMVMSPNGSVLYASGIAINTATDSIIMPINASPIAISPDGEYLYCLNGYGLENAVELVDISLNELIKSVPVGNYPIQGVLNADGSLLFVSNAESNTVSVINTHSFTVVATIPVGNYPSAMAMSPDGTQIYVCNTRSNSISIINTSTLQVENTINTSQGPTGVSFSPDGSVAYVTTTSRIASFYVINTATQSVARTISGFSATQALGNLISPEQTCTGKPVTFTITVIPSNPTIEAGTMTGNILTCTGVPPIPDSLESDTIWGYNLKGGIFVGPSAGFEVSLYPDSGFQPYFTIPDSSGFVNKTVVYIMLYQTSGNEIFGGNLYFRSPGADSIVVPIFGYGVIPINPTIQIQAAYNGICQGSPASFNAIASNGGASPSYQWMVNGIYSGTNSPNFVYANAKAGDTVQCLLMSDIGPRVCVIPADTLSNAILVNLLPWVSSSVSISNFTDTVCSGFPVSFRADTLNGGTAPVFQWLVDGLLTGGDSGVLVTNSLQNGDIVECIMNSNAYCVLNPVDTSNYLTMQVLPQVPVSLNIAASANDICANSPVRFNVIATTNGGTMPGFQWLVNGLPEGGDSAAFLTDSLQNGDSVNCVLISSLGCTTADTAVAIYMVIYPRPGISFVPDTAYSPAAGVVLDPVVSGNIIKYAWTPSTDLSNAGIENPLADPGKETIYLLNVSTQYGCMNSALVTVIPEMPLEMPSAFTPNGDGINDVFRIPPGIRLNLREFDVYDRWGWLVEWLYRWQSSTSGQLCV
jgi:YVTN family beta-propeller protein